MAIDFAVDGDVRYLSHRDVLRMFSRALARADLPVRYTAGFNPRPRLSIPLPRSVGVASDAERLVLELTEAVDPQTVVARLGPQLPAGFALTRAQTLDCGRRCVPVGVTYGLPLSAEQCRTVGDRAVALLDPSDPIPVLRKNRKTGRVKELDIRPFIHSIRVGPDQLVMRLHLTDGMTARPREILEALGIAADGMGHRIRRLEIEWQ
ncbi:MAG: DUF2344 domain-containing protein [Planctomycetes bacterium]|nr:DUF2344 domain-containing protein [Planctomycetota bacterium]